jgi:serine/threonine protein kinase
MIGRIGDYELQELLGQGGMALVYRAYHPALGRTVALKLILQGLEADPTFRARFQREARAAAQMSHPNIVTIHDYGEHQGKPYLVMEYVDGPSLAALLRSGPLDPVRAARIIGQVADALDYAHQRGFVHRDVKPGNILLSADGRRAVLADFGVVRPMADQGARLTAVGVAVGTPDYMSPEELMGEPLDGRSDLYSLGVVLYHALSGQTPFTASTPTAAVAAILTHVPPPLRQLNPRIPPQLEAVVARMMARDRNQRYQTGAEIKWALETALGSGATAHIPTPPRRTSRLPIILGAAGAGALALLALCGVGGCCSRAATSSGLSPWRRVPPPPRRSRTGPPPRRRRGPHLPPPRPPGDRSPRPPPRGAPPGPSSPTTSSTIATSGRWTTSTPRSTRAAIASSPTRPLPPTGTARG